MTDGAVNQPPMAAWRVLLGYAQPHRGALVLGGVLSLATAASGLALPLVVRELIGNLGGGGPVAGLVVVMSVLVSAALCGDNVNYWIGRWVGPRVFHYRESRWFNPKHLERAHAFYEKHGGKTIILARFIPIVRTYVPFVAGVGRMPYLRFLAFSVVGALTWVISLCLLGYFFGNLAVVKENLTLVILGIVLLSISPGIVAWLKHRRVAT